MIENIIFNDLDELGRAITLLHPSNLSVEIGTGNGHFIVALALNNKNDLIIGCDIKLDRLNKTLKKVKNNQIENILLYRGRGEELLSFFPDNSIKSLYVNFPDPWPKKRHNKRRFFNQERIKLIFNKLSSEGILYFVSDHKEYFFSVIEMFKESDFIPIFENYYAVNIDYYYPTLYFEKFKKEGKDIYFSFIKKPLIL
ncbi:MAG TPA: tRNA (guanosine(46)-N7)-methyltransferase TrmB [Spirochaetota bacterium]|nr:tRNA (guanosine(46)-N7)-methyltransferase TrmB [Spirochaetota bacterium]HOM39099.1 tRNA (guanosine(46)-N7)-methyltransferase TrmB [Spirochaetota bacterium]HPQ49592.1 tRNA (guanosine(46)-N7)-methyltransferase TrmB [Spirochaetota bacterium]